MKKSTSSDIASKLLQGSFRREDPSDQRMADPLADTPMILSLDKLRPYEHNPRMNKNPLYDELKESIRQRGLDQAPGVTRRPGEEFFIIRNGGNTRLQILNELWMETRDERFMQIHCLFRPWTPRGELVALTGHLAENDMHGSLTFIERALGVDHARQMYEQELGKEISQRELSRMLKADGYPISNSHISRMQETIRYLLPAIPNQLHLGLGVDTISKVNAMRKAMAVVWEAHAQALSLTQGFDDFFQDTLSIFDNDAEPFSVPRLQDELLGQMSAMLGVDYTILELDLADVFEQRTRVATDSSQPTATLGSSHDASPVGSEAGAPEALPLSDGQIDTRDEPAAKPARKERQSAKSNGVDESPNLGSVVSDVWQVDCGPSEAQELKAESENIVQAIVSSVGLTGTVTIYGADAPFTYSQASEEPHSLLGQSVLNLLQSLFSNEPQVQDLGLLLIGQPSTQSNECPSFSRLTDDDLLNLFRLIRIGRRLAEIKETLSAASGSSR
ncbi:hypothetical protein ALO95_200071 [Pseudomonas syringae pv. antirrhini]|uniref:ParB family protein n=1 Tax=Pseudomonas syringae group genomosp. 3 TaxID=251701 RepID=UPI000EFD5BF3|nr:ParB family protein [Pseudomonas syringae group genomosp. 3]RMP38285.1 hypothetical protein ALQ23_200193 [Pseudomonas syringae pv. antirrhini]RMW26831.1 hypothetical protein ALO95_200071 [Pseudomonas syringae pv. antirrhini]